MHSPVSSQRSWLNPLVLCVCLIPSVFMFATKAFDSLTNAPGGSHWYWHPPKDVGIPIESFLGVFGMFGGIPLGLLSLLVATLYLLIRFRHMNWGYRIGFVLSDILTVLGMWAILSIWHQFSK